MNSTLEFLVGLIGEEMAVELLSGFVKKNWTWTPRARIGRPIGSTKKRGGHNAGKTQSYWTEEEKAKVLVRAKELYPESENWATVSRQLSVEFGRTVSSMYNFIYNNGITKEFHVSV